jgi:cytochrome c-type biogenesis protein CcmH
MTPFVALAALMSAAAAALVAAPLLRRAPRRRAVLLAMVLVPLVAAALHFQRTTWDGPRSPAAEIVSTASSAPGVAPAGRDVQLPVATEENPLRANLVQGRFYLKAGRNDDAVAAYGRAYELGGGRSAAAALGLGEALTIRAGQRLTGEAGQLFEEAIALAPHDPQALLASGLAAAQRGDTTLARRRWQELQGMHPAPKLAALLEARLVALEDPIASSSAPPPAAARAAVR